ncbi:MAG: hypothetical protein ABIN94_09430 [Ferruginibacter sp.]
MQSNYLFENKRDYLYLTIDGIYNKEEFISYPKIISDECVKENISKVLINALNVKGTDVSILDRFSLGVQIAEVLSSKIKIAVIWPEKDINKFAENVASNRGGFIFVCGNVTEGENWLLNKL